MKRVQKDDRGFSLVEIIIVVAIMSVMLGTVGYGLSLSDGKPAEECARKLVSVIQHGRTTTMGKYRNEIYVKNVGGKFIVEEQILVREGEPAGVRSSTVGGKGVVVEYSTDEGANYTELTDGAFIMLAFDAGSGALKKTGPGDTYYSRFRISRAGTVEWIKIETLTGKVILSDQNPDAP